MSKTFAHLFENTVINVVVANSLADAELVTGAICVEYTEENPAGIGWTYDVENDTFIRPIADSEVAE